VDSSIKRSQMANLVERGAFMPTWILYCFIRPVLPRSHPWREFIPLYKWRELETALCKDFDDAFRIIIFAILMFILIYIVAIGAGLA